MAYCSCTYCTRTTSLIVKAHSHCFSSLFLYYHYHLHHLPFNTGTSDGLILSSGYQSTHILPMIQGKVDSKQCMRINIGGAHSITFMHRLLQLKYPAHFAAINLSRAEVIAGPIFNGGNGGNCLCCPWSLPWCPFKSPNRNLQIPHRGALCQGKIALPLQVQSIRPVIVSIMCV